MEYFEDGINVRTNSVTITTGEYNRGFNTCGYTDNFVSHEFNDPIPEPPAEGEDPVWVEPVTLAEAKEWLKVDFDETDNEITGLITAARIVCERYANLSFVPHSLAVRVVNALGRVALPYWAQGAEITPENEELTITMQGRYVVSPLGEFNVTYDTVPVVSYMQKTAIKQQLLWMFNNRGDALDDKGMSPAAMAILKPDRIII